MVCGAIKIDNPLSAVRRSQRGRSTFDFPKPVLASNRVQESVVERVRRAIFCSSLKRRLESTSKIRSFGWYGVGGIDVLIGTNGKFYFIDPNFRMTATFAYVCLSNRDILTIPTITFSGSIECSKSAFEKNIVSLTKGKDAPLKIISLTNHENVFRFNAGIQFVSNDDLRRKAVMLDSLGVKGPVLTDIIESAFSYSIY